MESDPAIPRQALSHGLLSFPVTDFAADGSFDESSYRRRIAYFLEHEISALFVAGGTGEFFSLSHDEFSRIVQIAVETVDGRVPVFASAGRSIPDAIQFAQTAEQAGCDGLLFMPPYLTGCPEDGLVTYATSVLQATSLPTVYYNRANGRLGPDALQQLADTCPNLIGLKDGIGDVAALNDIIKSIGDRLVYIGGVPTAEIFAEAYLAIGVNTYSSAVFNFMPELALRFYAALQTGDTGTVREITRRFFIPFCRLRDRRAGYAVSLIKAGVDICGHPAGAVRPPLVMPTPDHTAELKRIIESNRD